MENGSAENVGLGGRSRVRVTESRTSSSEGGKRNARIEKETN
jgi:hypothetical protein